MNIIAVSRLSGRRPDGLPAPLCYLRRVRVLRPRVLSKSGYFHVRHRVRQLGGSGSQSALTHTAMRVVRAGLLTVASALVKPVRNLNMRGGATRALQRPICSVLLFVPKLSHQWNFDA